MRRGCSAVVRRPHQPRAYWDHTCVQCLRWLVSWCAQSIRRSHLSQLAGELSLRAAALPAASVVARSRRTPSGGASSGPACACHGLGFRPRSIAIPVRGTSIADEPLFIGSGSTGLGCNDLRVRSPPSSPTGWVCRAASPPSLRWSLVGLPSRREPFFFGRGCNDLPSAKPPISLHRSGLSWLSPPSHS